MVAAGVEGDAQYLVTADNHLLSLKVVLVPGYRPLQIVTPRDFMRELLVA